MANDTYITGYASVLLTLNIGRLVDKESQAIFETIRNTEEFTDFLRHDARYNIAAREHFVPVEELIPAKEAAVSHDGPDARAKMSLENVGFLAGVFRQGVSYGGVTPTYMLKNKDYVPFPDHLESNVQFKSLFKQPWDQWDVFIRPTASGMFVVRLTQKYEKPRSLVGVATDVARLQMAFDVPSARRRLATLEEEAERDPAQRAAARQRQESIRALLVWLGASEKPNSGPDFIPVQWKLALEVCRQFMRDLGSTLVIGRKKIKLPGHFRQFSAPVHDSYVIYHFNEMEAPETVLKIVRRERRRLQPAARPSPIGPRAGRRQDNKQTRIPAFPADIVKSDNLRRALAGLVEGALMRDVALSAGADKEHSARVAHFPSHGPDYVERVFERNCATWSDEICILTRRAAIIMPSQRFRKSELLICNSSVTKDRVMYDHYWQSLEVMIEYCVEIRVLSQLLERLSAKFLHDFEQEISEIRSRMWHQDVQLKEKKLRYLADNVANLSRMLSVGRNLSTPSLWARAEYAVDKAKLLLHEQDVPLLFGYVEQNISNLQSLLTHIDELYLADLSERRNQLASWTSLVLAALSLMITFLALPSFWTDSKQLNEQAVDEALSTSLPWVVTLGNGLAVAVVLISIVMIIYAFSLLNSRFSRFVQRQATKLEYRLDADDV